jgi:hypothetical protein
MESERKGITMRPVSRLSLVTLTVSLLAVLHAPAGIAAGTTLYVKASGNDSAACTAADPCRTIKHAVSVANSGDTIQLGPGSYTEGNGVEIAKDITINGGWYLATAVKLGFWDSLVYPEGRPVFRVFEGASVTLKNITISGGSRGGVINAGSLTLENVWIRDNPGGGIVNSVNASLSARNVGIDHNSGGAGLFNGPEATALLVDAHVDGTYAQGTSTAADLETAGVVNKGALIMSRGLIAGNAGLGMWQDDWSGSCTGKPQALLVNVTISGNARGVTAACGQLGFRHVTIAANTTAGSAHGGLFAEKPARAVLQNSIVAGNGPSQCIGNVEVSYSFISDGSCGWPPEVGFNLKLAPLAPRPGGYWAEKLFHIGATKVHALLQGSSAIDAAADQFCTDIFPGNWLPDQLGTQRPVDGNGDGVARCDMGAFEYQPSGGGETR